MRTRKRWLIGITGRMGSGKTTIAKQMIALKGNAELYSIGQKIKNITFELDLPFKRDVLQNTGDFFRSFDQLVWINYLMKHIEKQKNLGAIIDDIRYSVEGEYLRSNNFILVRAVSSSENRRKRISERDRIEISEDDWQNWNNHQNESETTSMKVDYEIVNTGNIEDLTNEIIKFFNFIERKTKSLHDFIK
ncbi:MAG: AAA family ATPase [Candidatus Hodarchaeales archaeon]|jgi:dephospho-CoA kinase